jgi:glycosyltransferase involved in cell wall biosynthesis
MPEARKVLFLVPQLKIGGTENHVLRLCRELLNRKVDLSVITFSREADTLSYELLTELRNIGLQVVFLGNQSFLQKCKLVSKVAGNKKVVLHSFNYQGVLWDIIFYFIVRPALFITERRNLQHWRPAGSGVTTLEKIRNYVTDIIVANSEAALKKAVTIEHIDKKKTVKIHNGIAADEFFKVADLSRQKQLLTRINYQPGDIIVSNIANLKRLKRQINIVEALGICSQRFPANRIKLVLIGRNEENVFEEIEELITRYSLQEKVFWVKQDHTSVDVLAVSRFMILASETEGFSNAVLEAIALGIPVLGSDIDSNAEIIRQYENGLLFKMGDPSDMANRMMEMTELSAGQNKLAATTIESARSFEIAPMIDKYLGIYNQVI